MRRLTVFSAALALAAVTAGCADTSEGGGATTPGDPADCFSQRPIELVVGYDAGGSTDVGARMMATALESKLDATINVVNRPGAGGQVGLTALANAQPDGQTMGTVNFPSAIVSVLDESRQAAYDRNSFAPIGLQVIDPSAVAVRPDSPIRTPTDLVEAALAAPGRLQATTTGPASNEHFVLLELERVTGATISPVHFSEGGAPATTAFLGGNVDLLLANVSDLTPMAANGEVRVIGVFGDERSPFLPDVPTFAEEGHDVEVASSRGYAFPAGTPQECVTAMSEAMGEVMSDQEFIRKMQDLGLAPSHKDAEAYAQYWTESTEVFETLLPLVRAER
ncbi:tripartite tricarboxylate transporter substrate binding protein [Pseudonocardia zijingensis]|jgi:tripartite-type tricarboxylate transporter receptor subunit TctC|uniref:Tripartite tricarboxylate transporter substrate binding protein n=1 Tax=Pseudonocardia zijingensis TaxID=153376 RepID=A0ABN1Q0H4_9PSEU